MIRKAFIVYLACFAFAHVLSGCCNCPPAPTHSYRWIGTKLETVSYTITEGKVQADADTSMDFSSRSLMLEVRPTYELLSMKRQQHSMHWVNSAYAYKCVDEFYQTQQPIMQLRVVSLTDYDATHPAMSDITEYFRSAEYDGNGMVKGLGALNLGLPESKNSSYGVSTYFRLLLAVKPGVGTEQQFKVELTLEDNSKIEQVTPVLRF
jgi:hypothetical protein